MTKHNDKRKLDAMLKQFRGPLDLRPPQDPHEAAIEELARIIKKAMHGLRREDVERMPLFPRGFVNGLVLLLILLSACTGESEDYRGCDEHLDCDASICCDVDGDTECMTWDQCEPIGVPVGRDKGK